jgi:hypothetical protein
MAINNNTNGCNPENISNHVHYIDISTEIKTDILRWSTKNTPMFPIDIMNARQDAVEGSYQVNDMKTRRIIYIKKEPFTFIISGDPSIQFQHLEAILDGIMEEFLKNFKEIPIDLLVGGMAEGFLNVIPDLINNAKKIRTKTIRTSCRICNKTYAIIVKKSLIEKATSYPVSLVFFHHGHGLLIYIDKDFQVRGAEIVELTG